MFGELAQGSVAGGAAEDEGAQGSAVVSLGDAAQRSPVPSDGAAFEGPPVAGSVDISQEPLLEAGASQEPLLEAASSQEPLLEAASSQAAPVSLVGGACEESAAVSEVTGPISPLVGARPGRSLAAHSASSASVVGSSSSGSGRRNSGAPSASERRGLAWRPSDRRVRRPSA